MSRPSLSYSDVEATDASEGSDDGGGSFFHFFAPPSPLI